MLDYYKQLWVIPIMFVAVCSLPFVTPLIPVEDRRTPRERDRDLRHSLEGLDPFGTWSYWL